MKLRALQLLAIATVALSAGAAGVPAAASAQSSGCPWASSAAPIPQRVAQVLSLMTPAEKLDVIGGIGSHYAGETAAVPALCIPALTLQDGPAGVGDNAPDATELPAPIALAASWDPAMAVGYGSVIGAEDRSKGVDVDLGPTVNIVRDPRWGRAFETYGEDPYLTGAIGDGYIEGVQSQGVMAQVKHLAAYDEEAGRDSSLLSNSIVSERALQEIYLPPFQDAVQRAHVASAMCSYNEVNGIPACQSSYLMSQVLDSQFGFPGFVTSDWFATQSSAPSVDAGLDMQMPDNCYLNTGVTQGLASGAISSATLDGMVSRILTEMFRFGLIGRQPSGGLSAPATTPAHRAVAQQVAEEGTVLLKNSGGLLPLNPATVGSIAVIGSDGAAGAYTAGGGSATVKSSGTVTPLAGIKAAGGPDVKVSYNDGSNVRSAVSAAGAAKVAVVFADLQEGEEQDIPNIALGGNLDELISAVAAANPRTIVVLNSGDGVAMPWLPSVAGVLEAWYPGQEDGAALAALLFGQADPSGKLPVTFPAALSQVSTSLGGWPSLGVQNFGEGIDVGYRWFETRRETPLFPFGYGLSYTSFSIGRGHVAASSRTGRLVVRAVVRNTGTRPGAEVVQLYVGDPAASGEPPQQLKGFARVQLAPGQRRTVTFHLTPQDLSYWSSRWIAPAGAYHLYIGDSSTSLPVHLHVRLTRNLLSGNPPGPVPAVGSDSPLLPLQCPVDALTPDGNAILTLGLGLAGDINDLP